MKDFKPVTGWQIAIVDDEQIHIRDMPGYITDTCGRLTITPTIVDVETGNVFSTDEVAADIYGPFGPKWTDEDIANHLRGMLKGIAK